MKIVFFSAALFVSGLAPAMALGGGIQGRVLTPQGGPIAGATVTVSASQDSTPTKVITAADGSYVVSNLEPGVYTVTVSIGNGQEVLEQKVIVDSQPVRAGVNFRFTAAATEIGRAHV